MIWNFWVDDLAVELVGGYDKSLIARPSMISVALLGIPPPVTRSPCCSRLQDQSLGLAVFCKDTIYGYPPNLKAKGRREWGGNIRGNMLTGFSTNSYATPASQGHSDIKRLPAMFMLIASSGGDSYTLQSQAMAFIATWKTLSWMPKHVPTKPSKVSYFEQHAD